MLSPIVYHPPGIIIASSSRPGKRPPATYGRNTLAPPGRSVAFSAAALINQRKGPAMTDAAVSPPPATSTGGVAAERLRSFIARVERLEEDKANIAHDIKEVFAEAKGEGYDVKVLRKVISLRKRDPRERAEEEELLELYLSALGE
jgi:uncharacterized protein (UPF0335 family)